MYSGRGKLGEDALIQQVIEPASRTTTNALFNGDAGLTSGNAIDTRDYDEATYILNAGTFGAVGEISASVVGHTSDDASAASAISGAAFTNVTTANDDAVQVGSILCKNQNRYQWLKTQNQNSTATLYSAIVVLSKADSTPVSQTLVFDV